MPCYDPRDDIRERRVVVDVDENKELIAENNALRARLDNLTDLLCKTGRARYNKTNIPKEVLDWWDEHCEIDRQRGEPW